MFGRPWAALPLLSVVLAGCDGAVAENGPPADMPICRVALQPVPLPPQVHESSGIAASRDFPGILWTHNDSGGEAEIYALDPRGSLMGRVTVSGAGNEDWEDIAIARCGDRDCVYVADIGDNDADRSVITIYRFPEPDPTATRTAPADVLRMTYPHGPRDAEALFVLPGEEIHLVTKGAEVPISIYRYPGPPRPGEVVPLEWVRDLTRGPVPRADRVTGADATPDGEWIAVRTLESLLLYPRAVLEENDGSVPLHVRLAALSEVQGEGVGFGPNGAVVLTSEGGEAGLPGSLSMIHCTIDTWTVEN